MEASQKIAEALTGFRALPAIPIAAPAQSPAPDSRTTDGAAVALSSVSSKKIVLAEDSLKSIDEQEGVVELPFHGKPQLIQKSGFPFPPLMYPRAPPEPSLSGATFVGSEADSYNPFGSTGFGSSQDSAANKNKRFIFLHIPHQERESVRKTLNKFRRLMRARKVAASTKRPQFRISD
jgi:hypothetical protein